MKEVKEIPKSGQFVAVFVENGQIWSSPFRMVDGVLELTLDSGSTWFEDPMFDVRDYSPRYFIAE